MSDFFDRMAREWRDRAPELAAWTMAHFVNRTDVWGRYVARRKTDQDDSQAGEEGPRNHAITAPFRDERGKAFLNVASLEKHFKARKAGGILGVHSSGSDHTSRWLAIDIDLHDPEELSVTPQGNFAVANGWREKLAQLGFDPLLLDSNGRGGFHLLVFFAQPMSTINVHEFGKRLVADFETRGLDQVPEVFPGKPQWNHYGDWLRLPGRHHTHDHYTRVFNDEPYAEEIWLDGDDAIDRILRTELASVQLCAAQGIFTLRRTVCLDFDGVIHSYQSGWCGAEIIPDPPIHGSREAIERLRKTYRVVVYSARFATDEGLAAVDAWLKRHGIEVDELCRFKPPAMVYVDDRAIPFRSGWDQAIEDIQAFRK